jgi:ribosomal protein S18 acetylase RimI-like enzyme
MSTSADAVLIRRAEARDAAALGRLGAALVRDHHGFDQERFLEPRGDVEGGYGRFLSAELADDDVAVFVAECDGAVVGYVYAGVEPRSWKELRERAGFIHDVVVDPTARGLGIGSRLIETAAEWLAGRDVSTVMLWTAHENGAAQRLFERMGFRRTMIEMTRTANRRV